MYRVDLTHSDERPFCVEGTLDGVQNNERSISVFVNVLLISLTCDRPRITPVQIRVCNRSVTHILSVNHGPSQHFVFVDRRLA